MKNILVLVVMFYATKVFGQKQVIYGSTSAHLSYNYAYLYDSDTKILEVAPIIEKTLHLS